MARHALSIDDKAVRRGAILDAALTLFLEDTRRFPTISAIADRTGLAKGTVYLYFESKEDIFTALLTDEWDALLAVFTAAFEAAGRDEAAARFIAAFAGFIEARPYFLRLDSLGYALLADTLSPDSFWSFKAHFAEAVAHAGKAADTALRLPAGRGEVLLTRSYAMVRGLWQLSDVPDALRDDPRHVTHPLDPADFAQALRASLSEYWRGALADAG